MGQEIVVSACPKPHEPEDDDGTQQAVHDLESATAEQIVMLEEDLSEARKQQELAMLQRALGRCGLISFKENNEE